MQELSEGVKNIVISEDTKATEKHRMDSFYEYVKKRRDAGDLENIQARREVYNESRRLEVNTKSPLILAELLFSDNLINDIKRHHGLLLRFTHENEKAQKYLLGGVERVIALHIAKLMKKVVIILKLLYDSELLGEQVILNWASKNVSKEVASQIREEAAPFIKWLKEAEEESEHDDDIVAFDDRANKPITILKDDDDDGDAIDIDAI